MAVAVQGAAQIRICCVHGIRSHRRREEMLRAHNLPIAEPVRNAGIGSTGAFERGQGRVRLDGVVGEAGVIRVDARVNDADHNAFARVRDAAGRCPRAARQVHVVGSVCRADVHHFVLDDPPYRAVASQKRNLNINPVTIPWWS